MPISSRYLKKYISDFSHPGSQKPLQPWSERAQSLLKLAADLDISNMVLVFQELRMQVFWGHRDFYLVFRGISRSLSSPFQELHKTTVCEDVE